MCWTAESRHVRGESDSLPEDGVRGARPRPAEDAGHDHQDPPVRQARPGPDTADIRHSLHHQRQESRGRRQEDFGRRGSEEPERSGQPGESGAVQKHPSYSDLVTTLVM